MYSPARKVRASIRRTIFLIIISSLSSIVLVGTIVEFGLHVDEQFTPTRSAGLMLNRSQMLLAQDVILEPLSYPCEIKRSNTDRNRLMYPLFIIVKTRAVTSGNYFQRRMFTRTSWAREARSLGIPVIYAVGRATDEQTQKMLAMENRIYNDILQFNYIDAYYNISIKTVGILNWFHTRQCHQMSPYLFIVDDDVLINIPSLMNMFAKNSFQPNTLYGLHLKDIEPHPSGRWAVSLEDYPNQTYPEFITGASTLYPSLIITSIVQQLFHMINQNKPTLFLDDVLITGIIAEQLGISRAPLSGIEDCSYTDLFSRTIISECKNIRRIYVWSKFVLSRTGQDTFEIDRLIQTTTYLKWHGDFKHLRNGTATILGTTRSIFHSLLPIHAGLFVIILCTLILTMSCCYVRKKHLNHRQSSLHSTTKSNLTLLSTFVK